MDSTLCRWSSAAYRSAPLCAAPHPVEPLLQPRAPALEDREPDVEAVREKNANRTSKLSSSHAAGPDSVIFEEKCSRPEGVIM